MIALLASCGIGKDHSSTIQEMLAAHPSVADVSVVRLRNPIEPNLRREYRADVTLAAGIDDDDLKRLGVDFGTWADANRRLFDDVWVRIEQPGRVLVLDKNSDHNVGAVELRQKLATISNINSSAIEHTRQGRLVRVVALDGQAKIVAAAVVDDEAIERGLGRTSYRLQVVEESTQDDRGYIFEGTRGGIDTIRTLDAMAGAMTSGGRVSSALVQTDAVEASISLEARADAETFIREAAGAALDPPVRFQIDAPKLRLLDPGDAELVRQLAILADDPAVSTVWRTENGTQVQVIAPEQLPLAAARLVGAPLPADEQLEVSTEDVTRTARGGRDTLQERARIAGFSNTGPISVSVNEKGIELFVRSFDESIWDRAMRDLRNTGWSGEQPIHGGARDEFLEFILDFRSTSGGRATAVDTKNQRGRAGELARKFVTVWDRAAE